MQDDIHNVLAAIARDSGYHDMSSPRWMGFWIVEGRTSCSLMLRSRVRVRSLAEVEVAVWLTLQITFPSMLQRR